jgi:DNA polymerase
MDALAALRLQIEWGADEALADAPVDRFAPRPAAPPPAAAPVDAPVRQPQPQAARPSRAGGAAQRARDIAEAATSLEELRAAMAAFDGCGLSATATSLVFGEGDPNAALMFVGDAPGPEEDRAGAPFVGPAGQLLDRMLASIDLDRAALRLANLIPWRPPGNRNPTDTETQICLPFLLRHIALVRPRRLALLGVLPCKALLADAVGGRRPRGRWTSATIPGLDQPIPTLAMQHPATLLRTPAAKREAWADLLLLRRTIDDD